MKIKVHSLIRSYFKNLYSSKLENFMDKFLGKYHTPKLNQEQLNNLNTAINPEEIETVINTLPTKKKNKTKQKSPSPDGFSAEFYQMFKEELIPMLLKLFHTIETQGTLPNPFTSKQQPRCPSPTKTQLRKIITDQFFS